MLQFISKLTSDHSVFFKRRRFGNNILTFVYFVIIESQDQNLKSRRLRESKETKRQLLQQERLESLSTRKREMLFSREPKLTLQNTQQQKELSLMQRELQEQKVHTLFQLNQRLFSLLESRVL